MSQSHLEQFYSKASKDPALVQSLLAGTRQPEDFIRNAVKEGQAQGFDFTYDEAAAWIQKQQKIASSGELSDSQLETVAGGKGNTLQKFEDGMNGFATQVITPKTWTDGSTQIANWFKSW